MPSLNDPYGLLSGAEEDPTCEKCGCELACDFDKLKVYCPQCVVHRVPFPHCMRCDSDMVRNDEHTYICPRCGVTIEWGCPHSNKGRVSKSAQYEPLEHFRNWIIHILGWEPSSELGDGETLMKKLEILMESDKISSPSVQDCRRWLKKLGQSKLYKNTTKILMRLTGARHPDIDVQVIKVAEQRFSCVLQVRKNLNLSGKRYLPFYIYKMLDEILEGEQRWVLAYIHLQSGKTRKKCEAEWKRIQEELE